MIGCRSRYAPCEKPLLVKLHRPPMPAPDAAEFRSLTSPQVQFIKDQSLRSSILTGRGQMEWDRQKNARVGKDDTDTGAADSYANMPHVPE